MNPATRATGKTSAQGIATLRFCNILIYLIIREPGCGVYPGAIQLCKDRRHLSGQQLSYKNTEDNGD